MSRLSWSYFPQVSALRSVCIKLWTMSRPCAAHRWSRTLCHESAQRKGSRKHSQALPNETRTWNTTLITIQQTNRSFTECSQRLLRYYILWVPCSPDVHASSPLTLMSFTHTSKEADPRKWGASICCLSRETRCHRRNLTLGIQPRSSLPPYSIAESFHFSLHLQCFKSK